MPIKFLIKLIRIYQSIPKKSHCVFYPSCSEYMILSLKKYGFKKGLILGVKRIFKCYPGRKQKVDLP